MSEPIATASVPPPSPPRWVRAADLLCVFVLMAAVLVAMSGGFRVRIAGWRIAFTSQYRLMAWAVGIAIARHLVVPHTPIYRNLPAVAREWWHARAVRAALPVFLGTRPAVLLVGYLAVFTFGFAGGHAPIRLSANELMNLPVRFDGGWYLGIVAEGYQYSPSASARDQQNVAFFPAYPIIVRGVGRLLLGGRTPGYLVASVAVSLLAFGGALIYLYLLARDLLGDDELAQYSLWALAAYPFAVFYGAAYSESLFLVGATGAFYHVKRGDFVRSLLWGVVVGLTRPNGFLLAVPIALLAVSPWLPARIVSANSDRPADRMRREAWLVGGLVSAAGPVIGVLIFSAFIWQLTGHPFTWLSLQAAWGREYRGLLAVVTDRYDYISQTGFYVYTTQLPDDLLNGLGVLFGVVAAWPVTRRLGLAYGAFILVNILPPVAAGGLLSGGRLSAVLFPAFIWFATAVPPRQRSGWLVTFGAMQALIAAAFYTWRPPF